MSDVAQKLDPLLEMELERGSVIQGDEDEKEIREYILSETEQVLEGTERERMIQDIETWRRQREARPEREHKDFPWPKASNIVPPLALTNTNTMYAMLKGSLGQRKPFWTIETEDPQLRDEASAATMFFDTLAESRNHLNLREVNDQIFYDTVSLGTQFVKIPWTTKTWNFKRRGPGGEPVRVSKVVKDSPEVIPIPMEDFITRPFWPNIQRAPWVTHQVWLMEHELLNREADGIYQNVEEVLKRGASDLPEWRMKQLERMGIEVGKDTKMYAVHETYLYWDVDGDGYPEDIILWIDPITGTILRSEYNDLGVRPIVRVPYFQRPGELYSMGVGWMTQHLQDAFTTLMNTYINGQMLAAYQMYVYKRGAGIGPNEIFRPAKALGTDDPKNDFIPLKFPDLSYGMMQLMLMVKELSDRAVGASDALMGFENQTTRSRTTASGTMFLAQQGARTFAAVRASVDAAYSQIGQIIMFQLIRNRERTQRNLLKLVPVDQREALSRLLDREVEDIPNNFQFRVQTTEVEKTEEARRESVLKMIELYTLYGKQVFSFLPMVYNPQVPPQIQQVAQKFFTGATNLMEKTFNFFGEENTDDYLPYIRDIEMIQSAIARMKDQQIANVRERTEGGGGGLSQDSARVGPQLAGSPRLGELPQGPGMAGAEGGTGETTGE